MRREVFNLKTMALMCSAFIVCTSSASVQDTPKAYDCLKARSSLVVDGHLDEEAWGKAAWTTDFVDIQGDKMPLPRFKTRAKMLWDDTYLYIGAEMEEPDLKAKLTEHDAVIFHDNDFEIFLKPLADTSGYFEFEINALNTSWDLYLSRPYMDGGKADNSWEIPGLKSAVAVRGTLNHSEDKDKGWSVEIAIPWTSFAVRQPVVRPAAGSMWRVNFSRVEWKVGRNKEDNWVWSPQGVINMHVPSKWGYVRFR